RWKVSDDGTKPTRSAIRPAGNPAGPRSTSSLKIAKRCSCANAPKASITSFTFMTLRYYDYYRNVNAKTSLCAGCSPADSAKEPARRHPRTVLHEDQPAPDWPAGEGMWWL